MPHEPSPTVQGEPASTPPPPPPPSPRHITPALVAEIADEADVDTRTVERRLAGLEVRGRPGRRVDAALARRGLGGR